MLIKPAADIKPSEITPEHVYRSRRKFMGESLALAGVGAAAPAAALPAAWFAERDVSPDAPMAEAMTSEREATTYNQLPSEVRHRQGRPVEPCACAHHRPLDG